MAMPIIDVAISRHELLRSCTGEPVEIRSEQGMYVTFSPDSAGQPELPAGVGWVAVSPGIVQDLLNTGSTGFLPRAAPYVYSITLTD